MKLYVVERWANGVYFPEAFSPVERIEDAREGITECSLPGDRLRIVLHDFETGESEVVEEIVR